MAQYERGGMNLGRWPAEGDADLPRSGEDETPGVITDMADEGEQQRLNQLPEYEKDADESFGGGVMTTGGANVATGFEETAGDQPVPEEEGGGGLFTSEGGRNADDAGLPLGGAGGTGDDRSGA